VNRSHLKLLLFVAIIGGLIVLFKLSPLAEHATKEGLLEFFESIKNEWWGPPLFISIYGLGCIIALPGSLLTLTGGAIFGLWYGTLFNLIGASLGASLAFAMARFLGRGFVENLMKGKKLASFDDKIKESGFKTIFRLRLIPIVPFNGLNFGAGFSSVYFRDYLLGSVLGMIPGCFIYTYFADALLEGVTGASQQAFINLGIASLLLIGISFLPTILKKMKTNKA
jgi:uncharacterized membrane protein YdjX (TVP38/TMEM64 family)